MRAIWRPADIHSSKVRPRRARKPRAVAPPYFTRDTASSIAAPRAHRLTGVTECRVRTHHARERFKPRTPDCCHARRKAARLCTELRRDASAVRQGLMRIFGPLDA